MYLSVKTRKVYEDKLQELRQRRAKLAEEKQTVRDENAGYEEKKLVVSAVNEEIKRVNAEIDAIKDILSNAVMVERHSNVDDIVDIDDKVTVVYNNKDNSEPYTFKLVSTYLNDGEVSISSPLGNAVYGKRVGDVCEYQVNLKRNVKKFTVTIVGLENIQDITNEQQPE